MSYQAITLDRNKELSADCENCFGLCCVALPYGKSSDFAFNKDSGIPCKNLQSNNRCKIHQNLREDGFRGCSVYECFGAGQKVSQYTYKGKDWRSDQTTAHEMFRVFPIMQQLYEMLYYLDEALHRDVTKPIHHKLQKMIIATKELTNKEASLILAIDVPSHRMKVNELLVETSKLVRNNIKRKENTRKDYIGANLQKGNLQGSDFRGALLIACNLEKADLRKVDFIGADLRDANLSGADLTDSLFLTQAQINSAIGDEFTKLPKNLTVPKHWTI